MKHCYHLIALLLITACHNVNGQPKKKQPAAITIHFTNSVGQQPLVLHDSTYTNVFGESYILHKFKYYVSAVTFYSSGKAVTEKNVYRLINQSIDSSLSFTVKLPEQQYDSIGFLLGVDSIKNISGAQSGALDPLNDMFWTWRTGYIMEKLEGTSPQSTAVNNKLEYHLGGFEGVNNVLNFITLRFPGDKKLVVKQGGKNMVHINADISRFWNSVTDIKIAETPVCSSPDALAKRMAANFCRIFSVVEIGY